MEPSHFGENLCVSECRDEDIVIGSQIQIGTVRATVMQPRIPCAKLGIRMNDADFPGLFWEKGLLGFYLRLDQAGTLGAGDDFVIEKIPAHGITVKDVWSTVVAGSPQQAKSLLDTLDSLDQGWLRRLKTVADRE